MAEAKGVLLVKDRQIYVNTASSGAEEVWSKMCAGFESAGLSHNPVTSQHTFLCQSNAHTEVLGYAKQLSLSGVRYLGDPVNDLIAGMEDETGESAHIDILIVEVHPGDTTGKAKKWDATVEVSSEGGDGGGEVTIEATLHLNGEPTVGTFDPSTKKFAATT